MVTWQDSRTDKVSKIILKLSRRILRTLAKVLIIKYAAFFRNFSTIRGLLSPTQPKMPLPVKDATIEWIFTKPVTNGQKISVGWGEEKIILPHMDLKLLSTAFLQNTVNIFHERTVKSRIYAASLIQAPKKCC